MGEVGSDSFRVLVADDDGQTRRRLAEYLDEKGFESDSAIDGKAVREKLVEFKPHFVVIDLMLPDGNAIDILSFIKGHAELKDLNIRVLVTSGHNSTANVKECLTNGAADYVIKPFKFDDMLSRLVFHIQKKRQVDAASGKKSEKLTGADFYLHLVEMALREANSGKDHHEVKYNLTKMLALTLKAVRCSLIECSEDRQSGSVQVSSDDKKVTGINIDLNRYPEVLHVMNTEKVVVIEDMEYDPNLAKIKDLVKTISFDSMIVCPVKKGDDFFGVISARMQRSDSSFSDHDIRFAQMVAQVMGVVLSTHRPLPLEMRRPA